MVEETCPLPDPGKGGEKKISPKARRIDLPITGMSCAACSSRVQNILSGLNGVESAAVNLPAEKATIYFDPSEISVDELMKSIEGLGFGVSISKMTVPIKGMTCAACVKRVQDALASIEGVLSASVNIATETAALEFIPAQAGIRDFRKAVRDAGYDIVEVEQGEDIVEKEKMEREAAYNQLKNKLIIGASLTVPIFLLMLWDKIGLSTVIEIPVQTNYMLQFLIQTPVQFWVGRQFYTGAIAAARHKTTNMNTLIAVGTSAAYIYSVIATFFPSVFEIKGYTAHVYFDTAATIVVLILLGRLFEARAKGKT